MFCSSREKSSSCNVHCRSRESTMKDLFSIGSVGSTFVLARSFGLLPRWLFAGRMASLRSCLMRLLILMRMPRSYKQEVGEEPSGFLCARGQLVVVGRKGQAALRRGEPSCAGSRWRRRSVMTTGLRTRGSVAWMSGRILTQSCDGFFASHARSCSRGHDWGCGLCFPSRRRG